MTKVNFDGYLAMSTEVEVGKHAVVIYRPEFKQKVEFVHETAGGMTEKYLLDLLIDTVIL